MSKQSKFVRDQKIQKLVANDSLQKKRQHFKSVIKDPNASAAAVIEAGAKLSKLPRNSSKIRLTTRCQECGRPRAVYRRFGLCRICLRNYARLRVIPGLRKEN